MIAAGRAISQNREIVAAGNESSTMTAMAPSRAHANTERYVWGPLSERTTTREPCVTESASSAAARSSTAPMSSP
ncbi:Uncharacterised protein [Mycobacteroides abscessus subsp. abscessus]|nr:Uncharacterised protein [Mycobacteroides abscessus subsp. abscessus]SKV74436.1 Uncharacterised protein [Mycobacteroides abscessus subsp. abscessus]